MAQHPVELILLRQLASYLATPMFLVDAAGTLVYYNEAAEPVLGRRFEDSDEMVREAWLSAFAPKALDGRPLGDSANPLLAALAERREQHGILTIQSLGGGERRIEVTAIPLEGTAGRLLGAVAIFWPAEPT
ncbi:MAG: PAS domain-containing protein [Chloroflexota bacterium]|nr:PAS domain-containing protein [Chloroflexota bacterium]